MWPFVLDFDYETMLADEAKIHNASAMGAGTHHMRAATTLRDADPRVPPSLAELKKLFGLGKWAFDATDDSLESAPRDDALAKLERSSSTAGLDYEALLEAAGCAVSGRSEVNAYMENHEIYDFYTSDYVDGLADHLVGTRVEINPSTWLQCASGRLIATPIPRRASRVGLQPSSRPRMSRIG